MIKRHLGARKLIKRLMSPDRYTILFRFEDFSTVKEAKATNLYCDFGIITTTHAVIVEHARVAVFVVAVVILMPHVVGR